MSLELRVMADDELSLLAHVIQELGLLERVHRDIGHAMLARITDWHWQPGLLPAPDAPVWPMDAFRNRFLTAFSGH